MNPFEDQQESNTVTVTDTQIIIMVESYGRNKKTVIKGWNLSADEMKTHLKTIKKANGCNATYKDVSSDAKENVSDDKPDMTVIIQGDVSKYIVTYLVSIGNNPDNIIVRGN